MPPLEFEELFSVEPDENEPTQFFEKFVADAELGAVLGGEQHVIALEKEIAVIDKRAEGIYKGIAKKAAGTSAALAKNAPSATQKVARLEVTRYPGTGSEVIAEIGEHGEVLRTYSRDGAA
jgi:hypothetical protein